MSATSYTRSGIGSGLQWVTPTVSFSNERLLNPGLIVFEITTPGSLTLLSLYCLFTYEREALVVDGAPENSQSINQSLERNAPAPSQLCRTCCLRFDRERSFSLQRVFTCPPGRLSSNAFG